MIVVDTNTIAYLYLPTEFTAHVEELQLSDPHWVAPLLWRSEMRSVLAAQSRRQVLTLVEAIQIQHAAETLMAGNEFHCDSDSVLKLSMESGCSAYDCEFVSLAMALQCKLVTHDRLLLQRFPTITCTVHQHRPEKGV